MTIRRFLDLSTAHLSAEARDALESERRLCVDPHGGVAGIYGWWLWAGADRTRLATEGIPADLIAIIDFAIECGCDWICFDRGGAEIGGLPVFEHPDGSRGNEPVAPG
jgi:hypothetical protein